MDFSFICLWWFSEKTARKTVGIGVRFYPAMMQNWGLDFRGVRAV